MSFLKRLIRKLGDKELRQLNDNEPDINTDGHRDLLKYTADCTRADELFENGGSIMGYNRVRRKALRDYLGEGVL